MRKYERAVTVAILSCFIPAAGGGLTAVHAAPSETPAAAERDPSNVTSDVTSPRPLRRYLQAADARRVMVLPSQRAEETRARYQQASGRGLSTAAKAGIWAAAVAVGSFWAWKTFSVTRGTD